VSLTFTKIFSLLPLWLTVVCFHSDLLKRHAAKHNDPEQASSSASSTSKRRKTTSDGHRPRAQRACQACADAKARCEGDNPCLRCQQKSITCRYPRPRSTGGFDPSQSRLPQSQDYQNETQDPILNLSPSPTRTSTPLQMAQAPRSNGIGSLDSTSAQPNGFQMAAPSIFDPGKSQSP